MYSSRTAIETLIPPQFIVQALDDNGDGSEDTGLFEAIATAADAQVDAYLGGRFATPFPDPAPALVAEAAKVFIAETLYSRRGFAGEANPYTARANKFRSQLEAIGNGDGSLGGVSEAPAAGNRSPISIVTEPSRTTPRQTLNG
jgi:phage gp36-like protein